MPRLAKVVFHPLFLVALTAFACHCFLPFCDYRAGEDHYLVNWVTRQRCDDVVRICSEEGREFTGWFFWSFHWIPDLSATFKFVGLALSAASGMLIYFIALRTRFVSRMEALFLAVITISFPADKMLGGFMYSKPEICLFALLLATWLILCAENRSGLVHSAYRLSALGLLCIAFLTESLMTYFGGVFALLVVIRKRDLALPWYSIPWGYCFRRLDLLLLPFAWWYIQHRFTPAAHGPFYTDRLKLAFRLEYFENYQSLGKVFLDPFRLVSTLPIGIKAGLAFLAVLTATFATVAYRYLQREEAASTEPGPIATCGGLKKTGGLLMFGLMMMFLGTIPYVIMNMKFSATGEGCRYASLTPLPLGLILLSLGVAFRSTFGACSARVASLTIASCLVIWAATWWHNDLSSQAVQIRNDAIFRRVHADPIAKDWSIYFVDCQCPIPRGIHDLNNWQWVFQESGVNGEPRSIAFIPPNLHPHTKEQIENFICVSTIPYSMTTIDTSGKQGLAIIRPGDNFRVARSALKYLYYKHFEPERVAELLDAAVKVEFYPAPWDPALTRR